jgi:hypothetical protein
LKAKRTVHVIAIIAVIAFIAIIDECILFDSFPDDDVADKPTEEVHQL